MLVGRFREAGRKRFLYRPRRASEASVLELAGHRSFAEVTLAVEDSQDARAEIENRSAASRAGAGQSYGPRTS